jgi:ankyrin repeat protein
MLTAERQNVDCVRRLVTHDTSLNLTNNKKQSALHLALDHRCHGTINTLVDAGAKLNEVDLSGKTPLIAAVSWGNSRIVEKLYPGLASTLKLTQVKHCSDDSLFDEKSGYYSHLVTEQNWIFKTRVDKRL